MTLQIKELFTKRHVTVAISCFLIGIFIYSYSMMPVSASIEPVMIKVKKGMSTQEIGMLLERHGVIKNATVFRLMAKVQGIDNSLQAGNYVFTKSMTPQQVVKMLSNGETAFNQFTIPEGYTVKQIASLLEQKKLGDAQKFIALAKSYSKYDYMKTDDDSVIYQAEGFIFPSTYRIPLDITEQDLLEMMVIQFDVNLNQTMRQRAKELDLSLRDVSILASLVEKEARLEKDRPIIASVFMNRLKKDMPLQSCATIQYILGYPKPELSVQDTLIPSPYNTYLNQGLPPGPIANPGAASINAVLNPANTDYLYFVADNTGAHHFSRTYEEHLQHISEINNQ